MAISVTIVPDERRRHFQVSIAGTTGLSPRKTAELDFYAGLNDNEQVEIKEYDPGQLRMFSATDSE